MAFKEMSPYELTRNPFAMVGEDWMLITAGDETKCNTMTASWGQMGILWNQPVVNVYIRPQRYTREFVDGNGCFSLSLFAPGERKQELTLLGTKSGRDGDKIAEAGLTVAILDGVPAIAEAKLVLVCQKLYQHDIVAGGFLNPYMPGEQYPDSDFHRTYIAKILKVYAAG